MLQFVFSLVFEGLAFHFRARLASFKCGDHCKASVIKSRWVVNILFRVASQDEPENLLKQGKGREW